MAEETPAAQETPVKTGRNRWSRLWSALDWFDKWTIPISATSGSLALVCGLFNKSQDHIRWWPVAGQVFFTIMTALVPIASTVRARMRETTAVAREDRARELARLQMSKTLDPIVRSLANGTGSLRTMLRFLPGRPRRLALRDKVLTLVVNGSAGAIGPEGDTRSCYLTLKPGPPKQLVPTDYFAGRLGSEPSE